MHFVFAVRACGWLLTPEHESAARARAVQWVQKVKYGDAIMVVSIKNNVVA